MKMTSEEYLFYLIEGMALGTEMNIECIKGFPEADENPVFYQGKIMGLSQALGSIRASLRLYNAMKNGELPDEMLPEKVIDMPDNMYHEVNIKLMKRLCEMMEKKDGD